MMAILRQVMNCLFARQRQFNILLWDKSFDSKLKNKANDSRHLFIHPYVVAMAHRSTFLLIDKKYAFLFALYELQG